MTCFRTIGMLSTYGTMMHVHDARLIPLLMNDAYYETFRRGLLSSKRPSQPTVQMSAAPSFSHGARLRRTGMSALCKPGASLPVMQTGHSSKINDHFCRAPKHAASPCAYLQSSRWHRFLSQNLPGSPHEVGGSNCHTDLRLSKAQIKVLSDVAGILCREYGWQSILRACSSYRGLARHGRASPAPKRSFSNSSTG